MVEVDGFVHLIFSYRQTKELPFVSFRDIVRRQGIKEFIELDKEAINLGKGRAKSYIRLDLAIRIAIDLSPDFAKEVIDVFLNQKLAHLRDEGGNEFMKLNDALTLYAESILGKQAHKGHYITIAKLLKKKLKVENWNYAEPYKHAERVRIETALVDMLKLGLVRDWEHLKEIIDKI